MSDEIVIRPASPSSAKLLVGIYSESGNGKTLSSLMLALGFVGAGGGIAMIETESGRGEIYQGVIPEGYGPEYRLQYDVSTIEGEFSPETYGKHIAAMEKAKKYGALLIDSASHEWESVGGVLDMAAERSKSMKGPLVWQKPKIDHAKHFVLRLMSSPIPLIIVNMRAKYPMYQVTEKDIVDWKKSGNTGKAPSVGDWARSTKLEPKQSEDILYEMMIHGWIDAEHNFHVTKFPKAIPELREVIQDGKPITIETGRRLAAWAARAGRREASPQQSESTSGSTGQGAPEYITEEEALRLEARCSDNNINIERLREKAGVQRLATIEKKDLQRANDWIDGVVASRKAKAA